MFKLECGTLMDYSQEKEGIDSEGKHRKTLVQLFSAGERLEKGLRTDMVLGYCCWTACKVFGVGYVAITFTLPK